jgi:hypothetical protein
MATFQITIDDTLAPGIIATASLEGKTPEEVVNEAAAAAATKACQDFKVGPYYTGPIPPQFNADGTPYVAPVQADESVVDQDTNLPVEEVTE